VTLLACPLCQASLDAALCCEGCGRQWPAPDGISCLRLDADARTETVRNFYNAAPFPGYPPGDSLTWLRARAGRSAFAQLLDRSLPGDARIAEIGCGTGQTSLFLARADRVIVALDLSREALKLGADAARRYGIDQVTFVEANLNALPLKAGAFDLVYSSGVLHHTPDPRAAFARIVRLARPGGMIVLGVYNAFARIPLRTRRLVARLSGYRFIPCDPVLRDRESESARRKAWLRDQYQHPEEQRHTLAEVQGWFAENGVEYLRAYPSAMLCDDSDELFANAADNWRLEGWLAQLGW